tara:strand:- start:622 stop:975 length:354 start_codon:yes stop_codon:yes gene_type:complete
MNILNTCLIGTFLFSFSSVSFASDDVGLIVHDHYECEADHMAISTKSGWLLAEAYPPYTPLSEGNFIKGDLTGYGFKNVLVYSAPNDSNPSTARIYVDNYWMSKEDAGTYCFKGEDL